MMACVQQKTMSYGSKGMIGQYTSDSPPPADNVSVDPGMLGTRYGHVEVISSERRYTRGWSAAMVLVRCTGCSRESWVNLGNLKQGKSKGCQACSQPKQIPGWLEKRCAAWRQRCENPKDKGYKNYGGRGVRFGFDSVLSAGLWVASQLGLHPDLEIDRIENNGNYAPGNLRYLTHREQQFNKQRTKSSLPDYLWAEKESPLAFTTTRRYLIAGLSREKIVEKAQQAVAEKRKNWRGIRARLNELGYTTS